VSIYRDNKPKPAPAATVGFKLSKPGYDANKTAGSNLIFDSSWPSLPIAYETTINKPAGNLTVNHNLKFPPFSMVWAYGTDPSTKAATVHRYYMPVNSDNLYIRQTNFDDYAQTFWNGATKLNIKCFNLDLSQDIDYVLAAGDTFNMPYDNNYGIKVVKKNKDITSKDLRDFALHSRAQSPLIQAVKTEATIDPANLATGIGNVIQYTSKYTRPVWVYGFIKVGSSVATGWSIPVNSYIPAPYYSQAYPRTFTDGFTSYLGYNVTAPNADNGATLVILRDPMFASTQTTVQY
jgi:hypothetical protein